MLINRTKSEHTVPKLKQNAALRQRMTESKSRGRHILGEISSERCGFDTYDSNLQMGREPTQNRPLGDGVLRFGGLRRHPGNCCEEVLREFF